MEFVISTNQSVNQSKAPVMGYSPTHNTLGGGRYTKHFLVKGKKPPGSRAYSAPPPPTTCFRGFKLFQHTCSKNEAYDGQKVDYGEYSHLDSLLGCGKQEFTLHILCTFCPTLIRPFEAYMHIGIISVLFVGNL